MRSLLILEAASHLKKSTGSSAADDVTLSSLSPVSEFSEHSSWSAKPARCVGAGPRPLVRGPPHEPILAPPLQQPPVCSSLLFTHFCSRLSHTFPAQSEPSTIQVNRFLFWASVPLQNVVLSIFKVVVFLNSPLTYLDTKFHIRA